MGLLQKFLSKMPKKKTKVKEVDLADEVTEKAAKSNEQPWVKKSDESWEQYFERTKEARQKEIKDDMKVKLGFGAASSAAVGAAGYKVEKDLEKAKEARKKKEEEEKQKKAKKD